MIIIVFVVFLIFPLWLNSQIIPSTTIDIISFVQTFEQGLALLFEKKMISIYHFVNTQEEINEYNSIVGKYSFKQLLYTTLQSADEEGVLRIYFTNKNNYGFMVSPFDFYDLIKDTRNFFEKGYDNDCFIFLKNKILRAELSKEEILLLKKLFLDLQTPLYDNIIIYLDFLLKNK